MGRDTIFPILCVWKLRLKLIRISDIRKYPQLWKSLDKQILDLIYQKEPNLASAANVDWWRAAKKALSCSVKCCEILVCSHFFLGNLCLLQQPPSNHFQLPVFVWEYKKLSYLIQVKKALIEQTDLHLRKRYVFKYAADWIKMCKNENKKGKKLGKRERRKQELICISKRLKGVQN